MLWTIGRLNFCSQFGPFGLSVRVLVIVEPAVGIAVSPPLVVPIRLRFVHGCPVVPVVVLVGVVPVVDVPVVDVPVVVVVLPLVVGFVVVEVVVGGVVVSGHVSTRVGCMAFAEVPCVCWVVCVLDVVVCVVWASAGTVKATTIAAVRPSLANLAGIMISYSLLPKRQSTLCGYPLRGRVMKRRGCSPVLGAPGEEHAV